MSLHVAYYTLYTLSLLGIWIVAALVYFKGKKDGYRYFSIFALFLSLWLMAQFLAQLFSESRILDATQLMRIATALSPFFGLYFFLFATRYVGVILKQTRHFILPLVTAVISISTDIVVRNAAASIEGISVNDGPLYYVVFALAAGYVMAALVYLIREIRNKNLTASRRQADTIFIFAVLQALIFVSIGSLLAEVPLSQVLIPLSLFMMVAMFGYAIIRHRLFDIRRAAVRALTYTLSLASIGLMFALFAFGIANLIFDNDTDLPHQIFYLIVALGLALTFAPLKSFFDKLTHSIFYQDAYETQKVIDDLSTLLVSTVDIDRLSHRAAQVLRGAMKSQYVAILLPKEGEKDSVRLILGGEGKALKNADLSSLIDHLRTVRVVIKDEVAEDNKKLYTMMQAIECGVIARLEAHSDLIGYVLFGEKDNARHYNKQDIELIHITTDELALGIQNALRFEEIRSFNLTLQKKIEEATAELRNTNTELQRLDEAKDEFVSMASHQLRTPLTSVKGYISMVLEGDVGKITSTQRQLLGEAFISSERMVHLINDFLNVSRLQTGKFMLERRAVDLSKVVTQEVESLQTTARVHNLTLKYRPPTYFPVLYVDENKLRQVLMNFIDNAIYYSHEGTVIDIKLEVVEGEAILTVHDTGIGVPKAEQAHLFSKFFRATNARKQRPDGTGVGLFLAKKVVVAHGGSMVFDSVEGEGSTFGFRLPIKKLSTAPKDDTDKLDK